MRKRILPLLCMLLISITTFAQSGYTVKGTIIDSQSEPIIGATVLEKGTTNVSFTDINGQFTLNVSSPQAIVEVKYIGYTTIHYVANSQLWANPIVMVDDAQMIENVVVIGYGSTSKKDATGSVAMMKVDEINKGVANSAQDLLKGKVPGVLVTSNSGQPGGGSTIRIRGGSSLNASNTPLYVIDGVPVDNEGITGLADPLSSINPSDIESMSILKDASATAIFGSRASNGVIIITTKKGKLGKLQLSYAGNVQINTIVKYNDSMDATEFKEYVKNQYGETSAAYLGVGTYDTNWQKEILRTSVSTDHNFSVAGATKNMPYRVSVGFTDDQGIIKRSDFKRTTLSLGAKPSFLEDHLTLDMNVQGTYVKNKFVDAGAIAAAAGFDPTRPVMFDPEVLPTDANYKYGSGYFMFINPSTGIPINVAPKNPVDMVMTPINESEILRSTAGMKIDYKVHGFEDLVATVNGGFDVSRSFGNRYTPDGATMTWSDDNHRGFTEKYGQSKVNTVFDAYLTYTSSFAGKSKVKAMAGYSFQRFFRTGYTYGTNNYYEEGNTYPMLENNPKPYATHSDILSLFGRLDYSFDNKYLITATLRNDNSSRFHKDFRSVIFPSVALAWKVSQEKFLKDSKIISDLKLRLSYGETGQQDLGQDYPYMAKYLASDQYSSYYMNGEFLEILLSTEYDDKIKWETTKTYNIGIDFGFWNSRLTGSIDLYHRNTSDLLNISNVPLMANLKNRVLTNVGSLKNQGVELAINGIIIESQDLTWNVGLNATLNSTKITGLQSTDKQGYYLQVGGIAGGTGNSVQVQSVGYAPFTFALYEQVYDNDGKPMEGVYVDQNGDGIINNDDLVFRRSNQAPFTFGMSTHLSYKRWDFGLNLHGSVGNYVYNNRASDGEALETTYVSAGYYSNRMSSAADTNFKTAQYMSDYYLENASYLRLDNITVAHSFPQIFNSKIDARLAFVVSNVAVLTKYKGLDPECFGIDNSTYPRPRTYMMSLNLKF